MQPKSEQATVVSIADAGADGAFKRVTLRFADLRQEAAEVRAESLPTSLTEGDAVDVVRAALYRRWTISKPA